MEPIVIIVLFFGGLVGLIIWLIRFGKKRNQAKNAKYQELALRLNFTYSESSHMFVKIPYLTGTRNNLTIEIYENVVGSGKNQAYFTNIRFPNSPHSFKFKIGKEHLFSKMGKKIGFRDIEFDNHELDKKFLFKSDDEPKFRTLIDYKILHDLESLAPKLRGTIHNDKGIMTYTQAGTVYKPAQFEDLEAILVFMEALAAKSVSSRG